MRFTDQNASTKVTAASTTVTFTAADFDPQGVVKLAFLFTGAGMTVGDLSRIRVKNAGITSHDMSLAQYQAWYQKYYGIAPVAADTAFELPFHLPELYASRVDDMDVSQFVPGGQPSVELVIGAGGAAGTVQLAWVKSNVKQMVYPCLLGSAMSIAASATSAHFPINEGGAIVGFTFPTTGATRINLTLAGLKRVNVEGVTLFAELMQERNAQVVTDPIAFDLGGPQSAPSGSSFVELDSAAGWAGAANETCLFILRDVTRAA